MFYNILSVLPEIHFSNYFIDQLKKLAELSNENI